MSGKDQEDLENKLNDGSQGLSIEETGILGEEPFESGRPIVLPQKEKDGKFEFNSEEALETPTSLEKKTSLDEKMDTRGAVEYNIDSTEDDLFIGIQKGALELEDYTKIAKAKKIRYYFRIGTTWITSGVLAGGLLWYAFSGQVTDYAQGLLRYIKSQKHKIETVKVEKAQLTTANEKLAKKYQGKLTRLTLEEKTNLKLGRYPVVNTDEIFLALLDRWGYGDNSASVPPEAYKLARISNNGLTPEQFVRINQNEIKQGVAPWYNAGNLATAALVFGKESKEYKTLEQCYFAQHPEDDMRE